MKTLLSTFALFALLAVPAYASGECQPIYGGGQTCPQAPTFSLNKTVQNPQTNAMVDNLGVNDPKFGPEFIVTFQLTAKNTSNTTISHLDVKDVFPQFVSFSSGPGNFDANSKTLTFGVDNLKANESRTFTLLGRVVKEDQLPNSQGITCVVNQASATSADKTSQDNAQLCIQKEAPQPKGGQTTETKGGLKVFPPPTVTTTPSTGPEALALIGLVPTGAFGYFLRKKANKS